MEHRPLLDVLPIKDGDFPVRYASLPEGIWMGLMVVDLPRLFGKIQGDLRVTPRRLVPP